MRNRFLCTILLAGSAWAAGAQQTAEQYYQAIRRDDLAALRLLVQRGEVNVRDRQGSVPLFYAAAYGSLDAMRLLVAAGAEVNAANALGATPLLVSMAEPEKVRFLIDHGADVNARSKMGRTPLWIAAATDGASGTVKLLLDRGANPAVRDEMQSTPLLAATAAGDTASIRLLLDRSAGVNDRDAAGFTPLMYAAMNGNRKAVEWLLARGADVNAVSAREVNPRVKNGAVATGLFTPLLLAAATGGPEVVQKLLEAGADIDAQDVRGLTPLMLAIATDHADIRTIRLLLKRGANAVIRDREGLTAADWARRYSDEAVLREFGLPSVGAPDTAAFFPVRAPGQADPRQAAARAVALLERTSASSFREGGCVSCHTQNLTALAVKAASARRIPVREDALTERRKASESLVGAAEQPLLQRMDPPVPEILTYGLLELEAEGETGGRMTDAIVHNLAGQQRQAGNWHVGGIARAPMADGDFSRTALAIRALQTYSTPGRKTDLQRRVQRAATWLANATPQTTEDWNMQALGLKWAGASRGKDAVRRLLLGQHEDGGWGQTEALASDAYATGQTLYTLHELGLAASDPAYRRGVQYLLRTQAADGSWYVRSRAVKIQPYFESGFPYGPDQWISSAATAWAAAAVSYAIGPEQLAGLRP